MPKPATPVVVATDFPGMMVNTDPRDIPSGAAEEQINLTCVKTGEMRVRGGVREVFFEPEN